MKVFQNTGAVLLFIALVLVIPKSAYAYIDPGSVSLAAQAFVASLVGGLLAIKMYWQKLKMYLGHLFPGTKKTDSTGSKTSVQSDTLENGTDGTSA